MSYTIDISNYKVYEIIKSEILKVYTIMGCNDKTRKEFLSFSFCSRNVKTLKSKIGLDGGGVNVAPPVYLPP